jgi:hypothetical protein
VTTSMQGSSFSHRRRCERPSAAGALQSSKASEAVTSFRRDQGHWIRLIVIWESEADSQKCFDEKPKLSPGVARGNTYYELHAAFTR